VERLNDPDMALQINHSLPASTPAAEGEKQEPALLGRLLLDR
jgi:hypothetical protein